MLVRRERKYTLFFRLVQPHDTSDIVRMKAWNEKVEKAVGSVTGGRAAFETSTDSESDTDSTASGSSDASARSGGLISRGRQLVIPASNFSFLRVFLAQGQSKAASRSSGASFPPQKNQCCTATKISMRLHGGPVLPQQATAYGSMRFGVPPPITNNPLPPVT